MELSSVTDIKLPFRRVDIKHKRMNLDRHPFLKLFQALIDSVLVMPELSMDRIRLIMMLLLLLSAVASVWSRFRTSATSLLLIVVVGLITGSLSQTLVLSLINIF